MSGEDKEKIEELTMFIIEECDLVSKMALQLTEKQAEALLWVYPIADLKDQLTKMNNWRKLAEKSRSVYLTLLKWFEMDVKKGFYKMPAKGEIKKDVISHPAPVAEFLIKYPPGTALRVNEKSFIVLNETYLENRESRELLPIVMAIRIHNIRKETLHEECKEIRDAGIR